jgi:hypothetical protein
VRTPARRWDLRKKKVKKEKEKAKPQTLLCPSAKIKSERRNSFMAGEIKSGWIY